MPTLSLPRIAEDHSAPLRIAVPRRRKTGLVAGSLVTLLTCTALFVSAYMKAGHEVPVLEVNRPVAFGATITAADLTVVRIAVSGHLMAVPPADAATVVGRRASVALVPGELVTPMDVSAGSRVPPGDAIVGVAMKGSQLPAEGVSAGDTVDVVLTGTPGSPVSPSGTVGAAPVGLSAPGGSPAPALAGSPFGATLVDHVLVTAVVIPGQTQSGITDVSLLVPHDVAAAIADASTAGEIALIGVPAR
ncbi:MAG TPA: SAF domain-containing protein [Acidimicrobiales bacterium]|nr:SAF domain-containing protein [Acidimicrobiales bacterium]